jgi:hypothetical protein
MASNILDLFSGRRTANARAGAVHISDALTMFRAIHTPKK